MKSGRISRFLFLFLSWGVNCFAQAEKYGWVEIYNNTGQGLILVSNVEHDPEYQIPLGSKGLFKTKLKVPIIPMYYIRIKDSTSGVTVASFELVDINNQKNIFIDINKSGNFFDIAPYKSTNLFKSGKSRGGKDLIKNISKKNIQALKR